MRKNNISRKGNVKINNTLKTLSDYNNAGYKISHGWTNGSIVSGKCLNRGERNGIDVETREAITTYRNGIETFTFTVDVESGPANEKENLKNEIKNLDNIMEHLKKQLLNHTEDRLIKTHKLERINKIEAQK